jgi:outer membrane receptor protein involved in Fe transport
VSDGKTLDDDEPLDDIPVLNVKFQLRKEFSGDHYVLMRAALFSRDEEPGPTEIVTPGYEVVDVGAGWKLNSVFQLRFSARNLLDKTYAMSADRRAVPAPGINGSVTVIAEF